MIPNAVGHVLNEDGHSVLEDVLPGHFGGPVASERIVAVDSNGLHSERFGLGGDVVSARLLVDFRGNCVFVISCGYFDRIWSLYLKNGLKSGYRQMNRV